MTTPTTFLSHTSRLRQPDELPTGMPYGPHAHRKKFLGMLIPALVARIRAGGGDVWIDSERIESGEEFEPSIYLGLFHAAAAVVLVDEDALHSQYVSKEATILSARHVLEPDFQVLPVLLGRVTPGKLRASQLGEAGRLADLSPLIAISHKENRVAAEQIAEQVAERVLRFSPGRPLAANWVRRFARHIKDAPEEAVAEAMGLLGIDRRARGLTTNNRREVLAAALLNAPLDTAFKVVRAVSEDLGSDRRRQAVERVAPLWVDLNAAVRLRHVADWDAHKRVVSIATSDLEDAEHAVARGSAGDGNVKSVPLPAVSGENAISDVVGELDQTLRVLLHIDENESAEDIAEWLTRYDHLIFALLDCQLLSTPTARGVLQELMARFPGVVFVAVADTKAGQRIRGRPIELTSGAAHAREARLYRRSLRLLINDPELTLEAMDGVQ